MCQRQAAHYGCGHTEQGGIKTCKKHDKRIREASWLARVFGKLPKDCGTLTGVNIDSNEDCPSCRRTPKDSAGSSSSGRFDIRHLPETAYGSTGFTPPPPPLSRRPGRSANFNLGTDDDPVLVSPGQQFPRLGLARSDARRHTFFNEISRPGPGRQPRLVTPQSNIGPLRGHLGHVEPRSSIPVSTGRLGAQGGGGPTVKESLAQAGQKSKLPTPSKNTVHGPPPVPLPNPPIPRPPAKARNDSSDMLSYELSGAELDPRMRAQVASRPERQPSSSSRPRVAPPVSTPGSRHMRYPSPVSPSISRRPVSPLSIRRPSAAPTTVGRTPVRPPARQVSSSSRTLQRSNQQIPAQRTEPDPASRRRSSSLVPAPLQIRSIPQPRPHPSPSASRPPPATRQTSSSLSRLTSPTRASAQRQAASTLRRQPATSSHQPSAPREPPAPRNQPASSGAAPKSVDRPSSSRSKDSKEKSRGLLSRLGCIDGSGSTEQDDDDDDDDLWACQHSKEIERGTTY